MSDNRHIENISAYKENLHNAGEVLNRTMQVWQEGIDLKDLTLKDNLRRNKLKQETETYKFMIESSYPHKYALELEKSAQNLKSLDDKEMELNKQIEEMKSKIDKLEHTKISKRNKLHKMRDNVKISKMLTGTHFDYQNSNVSGYIFNKATNAFEIFNYNPSEMTGNDITGEIWKCLEVTSGSNWSDIFQSNHQS